MADEPNYYAAPNPNSESEEDDSNTEDEYDWAPTKRALLVNLGLLIGYSLLLSVAVRSAGPYAGLAQGMMMALLVGGQCAVNLIGACGAYFSNRQSWAVAFMLSLCAVGFAGFSACFGVMALAGAR